MLYSRPAGGALLLLALAVAAPAHAIDVEPIRVGVFEVIPDLNTRLMPTGSTWFADGEEKSTELLVFKPAVTALATAGSRQFYSTVEIHNGNYSAPGVGNYVDWKFASGVRIELDPRRHVEVRNELFHTHEGADDDMTSAARFTTSTFDTRYEYATGGGRGRFTLDAGTFAKDYLVALPARSNHQEGRWGGRFDLRVLPGAELQLQYRATDFNYRDDPQRVPGFADGRPDAESFTYVGATWEAPAAVPGELRIASGYKETVTAFGPGLADTASWETRLRWEPARASVVTLNADRIRRDRSGIDTQPDTSKLRYNWEYQIASQLKATVGGEYARNTWDDPARENLAMDLNLRMDYAWSRWVDMFVALGHDERRAARGAMDFRQETIMLGIAASLDRLFGR